jgi:hypothetical protein
VRGRFGRLALVVGALATIIIAWLVRRREAADAIRKSYETGWERIRVAREQARERLGVRFQQRGQETGEEPAPRGTEEAGRGPREEMRSIIRESVRRSRGEEA